MSRSADYLGRGVSANVLLVDDAPEIAAAIGPALEQDGYGVHTARTGREAIRKVRQLRPAVVVLDLGLPDMSGLDVCHELRRICDAFVLILSARGGDEDRLVGLGAGADDYVVKPVSPREIALRVRAMLRRSSQPPTLDAGYVSMDERARTVTVDGDPVELTRIEFDLLATLARARGHVRTTAQLMEAVWGEPWSGEGRTIATHLSNLRRKIGDRDRATPLVRTVRGVGYRLDPS